MKKYLIGIDEAGRGPLAGPVAVGTVMILSNKKPSVLKRARDSKQIGEKQREEVYKLLCEAKNKGELNFAVSLCSAKIIDTKGIVFAINTALKNNLKKLKANPKTARIVLDGSLHAPAEFLNQETIIKGDAKVPVIGLASIAAKVTRDRHMKKLSKRYPQYGFDIHKGYGTLAHREAIKKHGFSPEHRTTWYKG